MADVRALVKGMVVDPVSTVPLAVAREGWRAPLTIFVGVHLVEAALTGAMFARWHQEIRGALRALGFWYVPGVASLFTALRNPLVSCLCFLAGMAAYWCLLIGIPTLACRWRFGIRGNPLLVLRTYGYAVVLDLLWVLGMLLGVLSPMGVPMWAMFGVLATVWQVGIFADVIRHTYGLTPSQAFQAVVIGLVGVFFPAVCLGEFLYCTMAR